MRTQSSACARRPVCDRHDQRGGDVHHVPGAQHARPGVGGGVRRGGRRPRDGRVVRVFDRKCIDRGWPAFIGYTTIHPFAVLPYPGGGSRGEEEDGEEATEAALDDVPLVCEGRTVPGMTISLTLSTDTEEEPTLRVVPPFENAPLETRVREESGAC